MSEKQKLKQAQFRLSAADVLRPRILRRFAADLPPIGRRFAASVHSFFCFFFLFLFSCCYNYGGGGLPAPDTRLCPPSRKHGFTIGP
jgi:hypothetical protein